MLNKLHNQDEMHKFLCCAVLSRLVVSWLFATPWTVTARLLCPWGFSRQEYWSGLPCPPSGDLPSPGIEPRCPAVQADSLLSEPPGKLKKLDWVAYPFSRGTSWLRNWTGVSCIVVRFFTSRATSCLSSLYLPVCIWWSQTPNPFPSPHLPLGNYQSILYVPDFVPLS